MINPVIAIDINIKRNPMYFIAAVSRSLVNIFTISIASDNAPVIICALIRFFLFPLNILAAKHNISAAMKRLDAALCII